MIKHTPKEPLQFIDMGEKEWRFDAPDTDLSVHEEFDAILDIGFSDFGGISYDPANLKKAANLLRIFIMQHPEHIDAYHHLAMIYEGTGRLPEAQALWEKATNIGLQKIVEQFCGMGNKIPWGWLDNRPFLRACHSLGLQYMKWGSMAQATAVFETILNANPNDNQGIRSLLVECYFAADKPEKILRLSMKFPDDTEENLLYGKVLALFKMTKQEKAEKALGTAIRCLPNIARELAKKTHRRPEGMESRFLTHGSVDQAFNYWERQGHVWKNTPGALELVKDFCSARQRDNRNV